MGKKLIIVGIITILTSAYFVSTVKAEGSGGGYENGKKVKNNYITMKWREGLEACKEEHELPDKFILPIQLKDVKVQRCFNDGYKLVYSKSINDCNFTFSYGCRCVVGYTRTGAKKYGDCICKDHVTAIRNKYLCYFKGAGAVLSGYSRHTSAGERIFFQNTMQENYWAKPPSCSTIKKQLIKENPKYR